MLNDFTGADQVYIACGYTDLRKGIDGLARLVQQQFELDPFTNTLFLFCGRRRDRIKGLYCETLYHYLTCCHSLKKTSDALYTHRNTVLYRIRRLQEDFAIPLEEPSQHADLLLGVSLILFEIKGPDFFLRAPKNEV